MHLSAAAGAPKLARTMTDSDTEKLLRYERQMAFGGLGLEAQRRLMRASVLIVGVGGLGSWLAELLARAGVGRLRLVDDDVVDVTNLHRQAMYDEPAGEAGMAKAAAAVLRLERINSEVAVEPVLTRLDARNVESLVDGMDLILDGTDNFATRFIINDWSTKSNVPWVFAGVVAAEAQTMTILPGRTPCLRCVFDSPPPPCVDPVCRTTGVLGPVVSAIASIQAVEAVKILSRTSRDEVIAGVLNRNGLLTGHGNRWTRERVVSLRAKRGIPRHNRSTQQTEGWMTLTQAASHVGLSSISLRHAVERGDVVALHPLPNGPWIFKRADLEHHKAKSALGRIRKRRRRAAEQGPGTLSLFESTT